MLKTHDFYYDLPEELIAQTPLERRDASRLMTLDRKTGEVTHRHFYDLVDLLQPGDCLVMNNSRVLPARLLGHREPTGGRIVCVGTTSCRTLESLADENGFFHESSAWTDIFIYPGYQFKAMDALITNFHLPESTLVMLVSAFASREKILNAYNIAVQERYRFFSFGDAMYIY